MLEDFALQDQGDSGWSYLIKTKGESEMLRRMLFLGIEKKV